MRNVGTKNREVTCPLCTFKTGLLSKFEEHVTNVHGIDSQDLWDKLYSGPHTCGCGCGQQTKWRGWRDGYSTYVRGHWKRMNPDRLNRQTCVRQAFRPPQQHITAKDVVDFVSDDLNTHISVDDNDIIKPYSLDIYVPSKQFAIEFNDLRTGSSPPRTKKARMHKTKMCMNRGIRLLHVFSDEWHSRCEIVKSMIRAKSDANMRRIDARKCTIKKVALKERRRFFNGNHIDGDVNAKFAFGLYYEDELVQCMSLRASHQTKYRNVGLLESARMCSSLNTYVRGGLSRLTRHALDHARSNGYNGIIVYVDERLGGDNSYERAGWQFIGRTLEPSLWWTDGSVRLGKLQVRADRERKMSETDVANERGLRRVWGCRCKIYSIT